MVLCRGGSRRVKLDVTLCLLAVLAGGCRTPRPSKSPTPAIVNNPVRSPAEMGRGKGGVYTLSNEHLGLIIDPRTGDVQSLSYRDTGRNLLYQRGLFVSFSSLAISPAVGHVEKRDDQTWQYYGEDSNHLIWRKIYNLEDDQLFVSYMVQNNTGAEVAGKVQVVADLPSMRVLEHDAEQFSGQSEFASIKLHAFNEFRSTTRPALPVLLESDEFHLKPLERQSLTTQWTLGPSLK